MPIRILLNERREPLARSGGGLQTQLVRGHAYQRLLTSLERYCRGRSLGRSFAISGHRGAGKTTLVLAAVEELARKADLELLQAYEERRAATQQLEDAAKRYAWNSDERRVALARLEQSLGKSGADDWLRRTLLVRVSASDIVRVPLPARPSEQPAATAGAARRLSPLDESDNLLRQLARALHVSMAREFARCYRERVRDRAPLLQPRRRSDLFEAAAELSIELDAGARASALRRFWDLAQRFEVGTLFRYPPGRPGHELSWDQGMRELVLLDASAEVYRIAIGEYKVDENDDAKAQSADAPQWGDQLKSLLAPLTGLVGGIAGGFGVHESLASRGLLQTGGVIGAGLAIALTLTLAVSPKRTFEHQIKASFVPDTTNSSLNWRLERVVELAFEAGLAPVFVIDELDKLSGGPKA